jgi:N-acetyl-anhydromuramyl-L-alanine amidase AmpD
MNFDTDIIQHPSNNYSNQTITPKLIVVHWTSGMYLSSISWLCNVAAVASAHCVMEKTGKEITQLVQWNKRAWHAGSQSYHPVGGMAVNAYSIGIELEGPPSMTKQKTWDPVLIQLLADLCKWLAGKFPSILGITDHSTILPKEKIDVLGGKGGDYFPWDALIKASGLSDQSTPTIRSMVKEHFKIK